MLENCLNCGRELQPALECKNTKGEWDEHSYTCECMPGLYISIG